MDKNWCDNYEILLNNAEELDTREKIINSIVTLVAECRESFRNNRSMINSLKKLKKEFIKVETNETDAYFKQLIDNIEFILLKVDSKSKDEF